MLGLIASTFFAGVGASAVHTPAQQFGPFSAHSSPQGFGFSLEAQLESARFFAASTLLFSDHLGATVASGRVGWFVLDTAVTPYIALGVGWLREGLEDGDQPPNFFIANGLAVLAEAGVTGLRSWQVGRFQ